MLMLQLSDITMIWDYYQYFGSKWFTILLL